MIINFNGQTIIADCIKSVLMTKYPSYEIIIIDNGSTDGSLESIRKLIFESSNITLIPLTYNIGVTRATNIGIAQAKGDFIATLNSDTLVDAHWLGELVRAIRSHPQWGAAQCKLLSYSDPRIIDSTGCDLDICGHSAERGLKEVDYGQYDSKQEIFSAGLPASIFPRKLLEHVGLFDSDFFAGYEDADLSWRIRLSGHRICYVPNAVVYHKRSATSNSSRTLKAFVSWNFAKNWLAMLIKNYSFGTLVRISHRIILTETLGLTGHLFLGNKEGRLISLRALAWNAINLRKTMAKRARVQEFVRKVRDREIMILMQRPCVLIERHREYVGRLRAN